MPSARISSRVDRDQFVVRWKSGGMPHQVPVPIAGVANGRDAALRIAERIKTRVEANEDATDDAALLLFRDQCIAEENQERAEIAPIATAVLSPPDVGVQGEHPALVVPTQCGTPPTPLPTFGKVKPKRLVREARARAEELARDCREREGLAISRGDEAVARQQRETLLWAEHVILKDDEAINAQKLSDDSDKSHEQSQPAAAAVDDSINDRGEARSPGAASSAYDHGQERAGEWKMASGIERGLRPCSQAVYAKVLRAPWYQDVADGRKFFECAKRLSYSKQVDVGDLFIIGKVGTPNLVVAVAEVSHPTITKQTNRSILYSMLLPERKDDLDEYLGDAELFDYIQFKRVFDVRHMAVGVDELVARVGGRALPNNWQGLGLVQASIDASVHKKLLGEVSSSPCRENVCGTDVA